MLDPGSAVHHLYLPSTHSRGAEESKGKACNPVPQPHPLPVQGGGGLKHYYNHRYVSTSNHIYNSYMHVDTYRWIPVGTIDNLNTHFTGSTKMPVSVIISPVQ